jgi:hypothetical protein
MHKDEGVWAAWTSDRYVARGQEAPNLMTCNLKLT